MANILAIAEQRDGALRKVTQEVVSAARRVADALGGEVHVLLLGPAGSVRARASWAASVRTRCWWARAAASPARIRTARRRSSRIW